MKVSPQCGLTLIELLVGVALLAIVLALGVPAFRDLILNNQRAAQVNTMITSLTLARAEAVKRGARSRVCISDGGANPDCDDSATAWESGWLVVVDTDKDGTVTTAGGDLLVQAQGALSGNASLRGNANIAADVRFNARGFAPGSNGTLLYCDGRGDDEARRIIIDSVGRPRLDVGPGGGLNCPE